MTPEEFKVQIFDTPEQWGHGLSIGLDMLPEGGITLHSTPAFTGWTRTTNQMKNPLSLAVDECGQIYFIDGETYRLYCYDPQTGMLERIHCISGNGPDAGMVLNPGRLLIGKHTLWLLDTGNHRVQAFSRENFQIKYVITDAEEPADIAVDRYNRLYVLDKKSHQIIRYGSNGIREESHDLGGSEPKEPLGLTLGTGDALYVIDKDYIWFFRFGDPSQSPKRIADLKKISPNFAPSLLTADREEHLFLVDAETRHIHQFDHDGSHLEELTVPDITDPVTGLALDAQGRLYAGTTGGIAVFTGGQAFAKGKEPHCLYYSKGLDSGIPGCQWHRIVLKGNMASNTSVNVFYYSTDDEVERKRIDGFLTDGEKSVQDKAAAVEQELGKRWVGPEKNPADMLFQAKTGRYLWLKIALSTFEENVRPSITSLRVHYPRISYLRYLPAIYQEDPISKDFLERFLSLFEAVFSGLEQEISNIFKYFDPDLAPFDPSLAPEDFLTWLGSWLNLAIEEDWPEEKKRELIVQASSLYKMKGTPAGLAQMIRLYTGRLPLILETSRVGKRMVLGTSFALGVNSLLLETPVRGFRLGDDSILGRAALRDVVQSPDDPFLQTAHHFSVISDLSREEFARHKEGLTKILNDEKPAYTTYHLRSLQEMQVGAGSYVGISTRLTGYGPVSLGKRGAVGSGIVVLSGEEGGRMERHSILGRDTGLI